MRCLAVCQNELVIRMLDEILLPSFEVHFIVESKPLARRLHDAGMNVTAADPRRTDTYLKADITPGTCVIVEDNGRRSLKKILEAIRDAGGTLVLLYLPLVVLMMFRPNLASKRALARPPKPAKLQQALYPVR